MIQASARSARTPPTAARLPLVSREHGANLMAVHALLLGLVGGLAAGSASALGILVAVLFLLLFLPLGAAVSALSRTPVRARARRRIVELAAGMLATGAVSLLVGPVAELVGLAVAAVALGAAYLVARRTTGHRSVVTELLAIGGISAFAPLTWLLVADATPGWELAGPVAFLAFAGTVPYVRERVHRRKETDLTLTRRLRRGMPAIAWQAVALVLAVLAAAASVATWLLPVAFVPGTIKTISGLAAPERRPPIKRIGIVETVVSTVFAIVAGIGLAG